MIVACALQMAMEAKMVYMVADDTVADSMIVACTLQMATEVKVVYVVADSRC